MTKRNTDPDPNPQRPVRRTDSVRAYLHEIGRVPLLTRAEEVLYGKQVQQLNELQALHHQLTDQGHPPTPAEWAAAAGLSQTELEQDLQGGQQAIQTMMTANLRLVVSVAKKYQNRNLELLDLIQEGTLGLKRAVEKFDPARGFRFSTYAYWWIRQAITRAVAHQSRAIRLPVHVTEQLNKIKKTRRVLSQQYGYSPTLDDIAQAMDLEPDQVHTYLMMARKPMSLDLLVGESQDTELQELLPAEGPLPEQYATGEKGCDQISDGCWSTCLPNSERLSLSASVSRIIRSGL